MNPITGFFRWLTNKDKRIDVAIPLTQDDVRKHKVLVQELATVKAQLARMKAEQREETEKEKAKDKEQEVIKDLNKQLDEINRSRFGKTISLGKFFLMNFKLIEKGTGKDKQYDLIPKKDRKVEITDKDDSEVFGILKDIQVTEKGHMLITDIYNNPMIYSTKIDGIIYKPESLLNQLKRKRLLIPKDKNYNTIVDIENLEVNDVVYDDDTKQFKETIEYKVKVRELLIQKQKIIQDKEAYIERLELAQVNQTREINDLKRSILVAKNQSQTYQSELSQTMGITMQLEAKMSDMQRKVTTLTEMKAYYEIQLVTFQRIIDKLLQKMEKSGDKGLYEITKEEVFLDLERAKNLLPETIVQQIKGEEPEKQMPQPGQVIGGAAKIR